MQPISDKIMYQTVWQVLRDTLSSIGVFFENAMYGIERLQTNTLRVRCQIMLVKAIGRSIFHTGVIAQYLKEVLLQLNDTLFVS